MIGFYEVLDRTMSGKYCPEADFEMNVLVPKTQEVVSKYEIIYDPENPVPSDDDLADQVFQAGFELYRDVGTYRHDTERIICFTEEELREGITDAPWVSIYGPPGSACFHSGHRVRAGGPPPLGETVAHAVAGMSRKEANEIVKRLLQKYEGNLADPPLGRKYSECWDIHRKLPHEEYVAFYTKMKKEIAEMGIPF